MHQHICREVEGFERMIGKRIDRTHVSSYAFIGFLFILKDTDNILMEF